jgi:hypothetical protein
MEQRDLIAKSTESSIAMRAKQSAHYARYMVMVDMDLITDEGQWCLADRAAPALRRMQRGEAFCGQSVSP